ncbi:hypothetical protein Hanom_Chr00s001709g01686921 [Helianthus anomalus]
MDWNGGNPRPFIPRPTAQSSFAFLYNYNNDHFVYPPGNSYFYTPFYNQSLFRSHVMLAFHPDKFLLFFNHKLAVQLVARLPVISL